MWLQAAESTGGDATVPYAGLLSYGALGVMFVLGVLGYVYFKPSVTDLKNQNATMRADFDRQIVEMRKDYTDQIAALRKDHTEQIISMRQTLGRTRWMPGRRRR